LVRFQNVLKDWDAKGGRTLVKSEFREKGWVTKEKNP